MRKIIAIILSVIMLQSAATEAFAAILTLSREDGTIIGQEEQEQVEEDIAVSYEEWDILEMFYSLGITDEDTTPYSTLDQPITKSLFIYLLGNMYFYNSLEHLPAGDVYSDIEKNHYASGYVEQFKSLGIINGNGYGQFDGTKNISLDEAYILAVLALGYGDVVASRGTYPLAYHKLAADLDISISVENAAQITRREVFNLLYNMLDTKVYEIDSLSNNRVTYKAENTFMYMRMGLYNGEGIVLTCGEKSISGGGTGSDAVIIGEKRLNDNNKIAERYLGYNTEYFYNEDDVLVMIQPKKTNVLEIGNIDMHYDNNILSYGEGAEMKRAKIESDVSILYNGRAAQGISCFPPQYGDVLLIDNDNNKVYDVIIVNDYVTYYLDGVSANKNELNVENNQGTRVINLTTYKEIQICDASGNLGTAELLKAGTVIMVQESGTYIKITVCAESQDGSVNSMDAAEGILVLDGTELKVSPYMHTKNWDGNRLGTELTVHFDRFGNVAAAVRTEVAGWKLVMLTRAFYYEYEPESSYLKAVNELGEVETIHLSLSKRKKIYLDGERVDVSVCIGALTPYSVIRVLSDEYGRVSAIDTAKVKTFLESVGSNDGEDDYNCLYRRVSGTLSGAISSSVLIPSTTVATTGNGYVFRNSDTVIYKVPERTKLSTMTEEDIYIAAWGDYKDSTVLDVDGYFVGDRMIASLIVNFTSDVGSNAVTIQDNSVPMLVKSVKLGLDADDVPTYTITGMHNGSEVSYAVSESLKYGTNRECVSDFDSVKPGDIIRFNLDGNKRIEVCEKVYSADGQGLLNNVAYNKADPMGTNRVVNSRILKYTDEAIMFRAKDASIPENMMMLKNDINMYVYDRGENRENAIKAASAVDFKIAVTSPGTYEAIIIHTYHSGGKSVFFIK